jgi:hypothetical protein
VHYEAQFKNFTRAHQRPSVRLTRVIAPWVADWAMPTRFSPIFDIRWIEKRALVVTLISELSVT